MLGTLTFSWLLHHRVPVPNSTFPTKMKCCNKNICISAKKHITTFQPIKRTLAVRFFSVKTEANATAKVSRTLADSPRCWEKLTNQYHYKNVKKNTNHTLEITDAFLKWVVTLLFLFDIGIEFIVVQCSSLIFLCQIFCFIIFEGFFLYSISKMPKPLHSTV